MVGYVGCRLELARQCMMDAGIVVGNVGCRWELW